MLSPVGVPSRHLLSPVDVPSRRLLGSVACWVGTCRVLILCWVGNSCWVVHNLRLVHFWPEIPCWLVACWVVRLCRVCWARHTCRLVHVCWSGRGRDHCDGSLLSLLWCCWGQLYLTSGHVWRPRPHAVYTLTSVMMVRSGHGPMIRRWPRVTTLMMSGRTRRPDLRRPPRSTTRPRNIRRVSVPGSRTGPSRRCGLGPLPTPSMSGWVAGPWWVVTSLRPVTSSAPITTAWSMVFRSVGPRRHWVAVGPGSSHYRDAGWKGLLLVTGPGRPVGRLYLRCLRRGVTGPGRPVGRLCLRSLRRGGWLRSLLRLERPVIPAFGGWGLNSFFWCVDFNGVVHLDFSSLPSLPPPCVCVSVELLSLMLPTLRATSPSTHHKELLVCKASIPHWDGTAGNGSVYHSVFYSASNQETSVAVAWKMTYHVTLPSCLVVNQTRLTTKME